MVDVKDKAVVKEVVSKVADIVHHGECFFLRHSVVLFHLVEKSGCICKQLVDFADWILSQQHSDRHVGCVHVDVELKQLVNPNKNWS